MLPPAAPVRLSTSEEDYLKALFTLGEWDPTPVGTGVLANQLGISPASVTLMVRKLAAKHLVHFVPRGAIGLSATGRSAALQIVRRHRVLETFLCAELGYRWDEVHEEAEQLEHTVSERFINAVDQRLGFPTHDPHGDAIPQATGHHRHPQATRLDHFSGTAARIVRISDEDPQFLRRCLAAGLVPGAPLALPHTLDEIEASMLWVAAP